MRNFSQYFQIKTRANGDTFVCLSDSAPDCLSDLVCEIHQKSFGGAFPNDWIYDKVHDAFDRLEQCESDSEYDDARGEIEADVYTCDLLEWAKSSWAREFINQASLEFGPQKDIESAISWGQYLAIAEIYGHVWDFLGSQVLEEDRV